MNLKCCFSFLIFFSLKCILPIPSCSDQTHAENLMLEAFELHGLTVKMNTASGCQHRARRLLLKCNKQMLYQGPRILQLSKDRYLCVWHFDSYAEIILVFTVCRAFPYWYLVAEASKINCNLKAAFSSIYLKSTKSAWGF